MLSLSGKALVICHPERSEVPRATCLGDFAYAQYDTYFIIRTPIFWYALPLKRGRRIKNKGGRMTDRLSRECRLIKNGRYLVFQVILLLAASTVQ